MRLRPSIIAFIGVCWALISSFSVIAQEGKAQSEIESLGSLRSDPEPDLTETEIRNNKSTGAAGITKEVVRDSVQMKPPTTFKPVEKAEKEGDDPLSFNFLYYIIEKFKLSDIIE